MAKCPFISPNGLDLTYVYMDEDGTTYNPGGAMPTGKNSLVQVITAIQPGDCPESDTCKLWNASTNKCSLEEAAASPVTTSIANTLVSEFISNEDMDYNGYVYGYDFKITDSSSKPVVLKSIESNPSWGDPDISITWDEMKTWNDEGTIPDAFS